MMDNMMLYMLIYALAAAQGREKALFGPHAVCGREAFMRSVPGKCFPELWFELPLTGEPWFDLHVLTTSGDLDAADPPAPDTCGGYAEAFRWFASAQNVRQLALSWDLNAGRPAAAIQLLLSRRDDDTACDFLSAAGKPEAAPACRAFLGRMPGDWFACYLGVFPSRPRHHLRLECIPSASLQKAYAQDVSLLARHLSQVGLTNLEDSVLPRCQLLAASPFQFEFQFDVGQDGTACPVLGASLRFALGKGTDRMEAFRTGGAAGRIMAEIENWGLADSRWRLLEDTAFARRVTHGLESSLLYCAPVFVKLRWREGKPLDAKVYLQAGEQKPVE